MRCPTLNELPPPPPGKTGWPWTEESPQLPYTMSDGSPWLRVSIVTPSYNQAQFIEETIRSVLLQGYPDLEYIIIDGGSTDGSVDIIRKYEPWLAYWVSEPDRGQTHAINKGFARATGDIVAWLNSDDTYLPGAVRQTVQALEEHPRAGFVYGILNLVDEAGNLIRRKLGGPLDRKRLLGRAYFGQPTVFMRKAILQQVGYLDESLFGPLDWELWIRLAQISDAVYLPVPLANATVWPGAKTEKHTLRFYPEHREVLRRLQHDETLPAELKQEIPEVIAGTYWAQAKKTRRRGGYLGALWSLAHIFVASPRHVRSIGARNLLRALLPPRLEKIARTVKAHLRWDSNG